jgi:hypothetical protein
MSPLAKAHPTAPGIAHRFEVYVAGLEVRSPTVIILDAGPANVVSGIALNICSTCLSLPTHTPSSTTPSTSVRGLRSRSASPLSLRFSVIGSTSHPFRPHTQIAAQASDRAAGDMEAMPADEEFCTALECALSHAQLCASNVSSFPLLHIPPRLPLQIRDAAGGRLGSRHRQTRHGAHGRAEHSRRHTVSDSAAPCVRRR